MNDMPTKKQGTQLSANLIAVRIPKTKNKTAADIQITSEQLIREALANQTDDLKPPRARFTDEEELVEYQLRKRMEFENEVKKQKYHIHS